jgi:endonuclease YncB( thermonuclease family)
VLNAQVLRITDGDTVDVVDQGGVPYTIRLAGIDAPEHDQAFGTESTQHLSGLISGKSIALKCGNERSYGRLICKILLDGDDICLDQVRDGMAWHYKQYQDEQSPSDRDAYAAAEVHGNEIENRAMERPAPSSAAGFSPRYKLAIAA